MGKTEKKYSPWSFVRLPCLCRIRQATGARTRGTSRGDGKRFTGVFKTFERGGPPKLRPQKRKSFRVSIKWYGLKPH